MGRRLVPLLDAAVPLVAVTVAVGGGYMHSDRDVRPVGVVLGVLAGLVMAGRRRVPGLTVAATAAISLVLLGLDPAIAPYAMLVPAAALLSVALLASGPWGALAGAAGVAVVLAAEAVNDHRPGVWASLQHVAMLAVPILAAEMLRTRRSYRAVLLERLALVEAAREADTQRRVQDERLRIARDLHDVVAHTLTTINVQAGVAGHLLDERPEHARGALAAIEEASRNALGELRGIVGVLRDPGNGQAPRIPAPGLDDLPGLIELARGAGLGTDLSVSGPRPELVPEGVALAAYRIVQESLTNAARHTTGARVRVQLAFTPGELTICVENTKPPGPPIPHLAGGVGIIGMTERAEAVGGSLHTADSDGTFRVAARLPLPMGAA